MGMFKDLPLRDFTSHGYTPSPPTYIRYYLYHRSLVEERKIFNHSKHGTGTVEGYEELFRFLKTLNLRVMEADYEEESEYFKLYTSEERSNDNNHLVDPETYVYISWAKSNQYLGIEVCSINKDIFKQIVQKSKDFIGPENKGNVHTIITRDGGYDFQNLGVGFIELERGNYSQDILNSYDHIVKDIKSEKPCGKFSFLEGKPGTGKTHLVRALLGDIYKDSTAIVIPPALITNVASPDMVNLFISNKDTYAKNKSYTLIIEDADTILVQRGTDNMSSVQSLLNLSDGIMGSLLDMRIVATTNAINEVDEALTRPGRMCRRIAVGETQIDLCNKIYSRLTGNDIKFNKPSSLAEIYRMAHDCKEEGIEPVLSPEKRKIGFS